MKSLFLVSILFLAQAVFSQIIVTPIVGTPTCFGSQTGSIALQLDPSSFSPPVFFYIINNQGDTLNNPMTNVANILPGGQYYYYSVIDANGLSVFDSVFISQPLPVTISALTTQPNLPPDQGTIEITIGGGAVYPVSVIGSSSNGTSIPFQNLSAPAPISYPALDTGFYYFDVIDDNGCANDTTIAITFQSPIPPISFNISPTQPFSTPGVGSIAIQNITGNISPVSNLEITVVDAAMTSFPLTGLVADNLPPSTYTVTVTDTLSTMTHSEVVTLQFQDLSFGDNTLANIKVFSPQNGTIQILNAPSLGDYTVFNITGQKVARGVMKSNTQIGSLQTGMYFIKIEKDGKEVTKKVMVR